jgi:hypothetical protein
MLSEGKKTVVLLFDERSPGHHHLKKWLHDRGYLAWEANDVCHAIEELSDFTVESRPDVVMLAVQSLEDNYAVIRDALQISPSNDSISVFAVGPEYKTGYAFNCIPHIAALEQNLQGAKTRYANAH